MKKNLFSLFLLLSAVYSFAQHNDVSSLQEQLKSASSKQSQIITSTKLIEAYAPINLDSSIFYFEKAFYLAQEINHTPLIIGAQNTITENLMIKGDYTRAKTLIDQGIALGHQLQNDSIICSNMMTLVTWHWEMSNTKQSFEVIKEALKYAERAGNIKYKAMIYSSYGIFYGDQKDADKEREYFQKSYQIFKEIKDTTNQIILLQNIANSYFYTEDFSIALEHTNQALSLIKEFTAKDLLYEFVLGFKGAILYKLGETERGFAILDSVYTIAIANHNSRLIVLSGNEKSKWLLEDKKYDEAIRIADNAVKICKETGYIHQLPELCSTISQAYKAKKDFESALLWINEENQALEEIKNRQQDKELILLEANHELQQKDAENQILLLKNKNQKSFFAFFVVLIILCSAFVIYFFRKGQQKKLEIFRQRIAADLHDDVGSNLNSITRLAKGLKANKNKQDINDGIDQLVKKSNTTIQNVVDVIWSLDQEESTLEDLIIKMEGYLDGVRSVNKDVDIRFVKKNIFENISLPIKVKHHLLMVFKEGINNIQKHTNPSLIKIELEQNKKVLRMNITNYFQTKKENSNSTGRGIINIRRRINDLGGVVEINDSDHEFQLQIKLKNLDQSL